MKKQMAPKPTGRVLPEFLRPQDIGKLGTVVPATVLEARAQRRPKYGPTVLVDVKIGKTVYSWSVKTDTSNYAVLYEKFGGTLDKWAGTVRLEVRKSERSDSGLTVVVLR